MPMQHKRSLSSDINMNHIPLQGQLAIEMPSITNTSTSPFRMKIGDGTSTYEQLPYFGESSGSTDNWDTVFVPVGSSSDSSKMLKIPELAEPVQYTGSIVSPEWTNFNINKMSISGDTQAIEIGAYTVYFEPVSGYTWYDGTSDAKAVSWEIISGTVQVPQMQGSLVYNGETQSPSWRNFDSNKMTQSGVLEGVDAGDYYASYTLLPGFLWPDGTDGTKEVVWTIERKPITHVPVQTNTLTYNGQVQVPIFDELDKSLFVEFSDPSGITAGTWDLTLIPLPNYKWYDNSYAKYAHWTINKASSSLSIDTSAVTVSNSEKSVSRTMSYVGEYVTATSSDTDIALAYVSSNSIVITGVGLGSATITVYVAQSTNYLESSHYTINVTSQVTPTFEETSWAKIREISKNSQGANYWAPGDQKSITMTGTLGPCTFSPSDKYFLTILGFNHNATREGTGIHLLGFDRAANLTTSYRHSIAIDGGFRYNSDTTSNSGKGTNKGGWKSCDLRYSILGSTDKKGVDASITTATKPVSGTLMEILPADLRAVMQPITKYTDNTGNHAGSTANATSSNVTKTVDYLPLLSPYEVWGSSVSTDIWGNTPPEYAYQQQYAYFASITPAYTRRYEFSSTSPGVATSTTYGSRSPSTSDSYSFYGFGVLHNSNPAYENIGFTVANLVVILKV